MFETVGLDLQVDRVPEHRAPLKLSRGQPYDSTFATPHPDLDELRFQVHYVQEVVYIFAIVPLVHTLLIRHSELVQNRELLKSSLIIRHIDNCYCTLCMNIIEPEMEYYL